MERKNINQQKQAQPPTPNPQPAPPRPRSLNFLFKGWVSIETIATKGHRNHDIPIKPTNFKSWNHLKSDWWA